MGKRRSDKGENNHMDVNPVTHNNALDAYSRQQAAAKAVKAKAVVNHAEAGKGGGSSVMRGAPVHSARHAETEVPAAIGLPAATSGDTVSFSSVVSTLSEERLSKVEQGDGSVDTVSLGELVNEAELALQMAHVMCNRMTVLFDDLLRMRL